MKLPAQVCVTSNKADKVFLRYRRHGLRLPSSPQASSCSMCVPKILDGLQGLTVNVLISILAFIRRVDSYRFSTAEKENCKTTERNLACATILKKLAWKFLKEAVKVLFKAVGSARKNKEMEPVFCLTIYILLSRRPISSRLETIIPSTLIINTSCGLPLPYILQTFHDRP